MRSLRRFPRRAVLAVSVGLAVCALPSATGAAAKTSQQARAAAVNRQAYATTLRYAIRFYPRFFSYFIQKYVTNAGSLNRFSYAITSPTSGLVGDQFRLVNAINVDTTYGAMLSLDLTKGPQILTMPGYDHVASILNLDVFSQVFNPGIDPTAKGTYGLVPPGWQGTLPPGVKRVEMPIGSENFIRADRYTNTGVNVIADSKAFVKAIRLTSLAAYRADPMSGPAIAVPQIALRPSPNIISTQEMLHAQTKYLRFLQEALRAPTTAGSLSASDLALSRAFDRVFAAAQQGVEQGDNGEMSQIVNAVRTANHMIYNHYYSHLLPDSQWITFANAAASGTHYLDNDAFQSFVLFGNSNTTTRYFDTFSDHLGIPLDTDNFPFYRMTIPKADIPDANRFWSLTAYVPPAPSLVPGTTPNGNNGQGNVASYTPGLQRNKDGSITIYIQPNRPAIPARRPNWLRVPPDGPFSMVLRVYGPTGNTAPGTLYIPPEVKPLGIL